MAIARAYLIQNMADVISVKDIETPLGMKSFMLHQGDSQRLSECGLIYVQSVMRESIRKMTKGLNKRDKNYLKRNMDMKDSWLYSSGIILMKRIGLLNGWTKSDTRVERSPNLIK